MSIYFYKSLYKFHDYVFQMFYETIFLNRKKYLNFSEFVVYTM